jgi:hypothetical protein
MAFKLTILSGPSAGQSYDLQPGLTIGRGSAGIPLIDAKISGQHAKIEKLPSGEWVILDMGSRNGLLVEGAKTNQIALKNGLKVQIGTTLCEVMEITDNSPSGAPASRPARQAPPPPKVALASFEYLADFALRSQGKVKNKPVALAPFKPLVVLTVTHGRQAGTEWILGYGPRTVGANSVDMPILDGPDIAFSIEPDHYGARFATNFPDKVRLNERSVSSEKLNDGDTISFSENRIKVSFKE